MARSSPTSADRCLGTRLCWEEGGLDGGGGDGIAEEGGGGGRKVKDDPPVTKAGAGLLPGATEADKTRLGMAACRWGCWDEALIRSKLRFQLVFAYCVVVENWGGGGGY